MQPCHQIQPDLQGFLYTSDDGLPVKVSIGDGGKEVQSHQMIYLTKNRLPLFPQTGSHGSNPLGNIYQQILHSRHLRGLAADPHLGAALAACRLLTLEAKHLILHESSLLYDSIHD